MKRTLITFALLLATFVSISAWAEDVTEINGIYYVLDDEAKTASLTSAMGGCSGDFTIPASVSYGGSTYSVTSIGKNAFYDCIGMTSIDIPGSVTSIGEMAFWNCSALMSVTIGSGVTSIGGGVFLGCDALTSIRVDSGNKVFDSREGCNAIIATETNTLFFGCKSTIIPNSVTTIRSYAFSLCIGLKSINIPNSVTIIGASAFEGCTGLASVSIPNSVTNIGWFAFRGCSSLTSVAIPNSVTDIGCYAFMDCTNLTSITIGNSAGIGTAAFAGCTRLSGVTSLSTAPSENYCDRDAFYESPITSCTLHVPVGCADAFRAIAPWSDFGSIVGDIETSVTPVEFNRDAAKYYNIKGQQFINAQPGVNIIRFSDGTSKKVIMN